MWGTRRQSFAVYPEVKRIWRKWLGRRRRDGVLPWAQMTRLLEHYSLPKAVVVHSMYRRAANP